MGISYPQQDFLLLSCATILVHGVQKNCKIERDQRIISRRGAEAVAFLNLHSRVAQSPTDFAQAQLVGL